MLKFIKCEEKDIPKPGKDRYPLKQYLDEFLHMHIKVAKVDFGEHYKSPSVAATCISHSVRTYGLPIIVTQRKDEIYLIRKDM